MAASAVQIAAVLSALRTHQPAPVVEAATWSRQELSGRLSELSGSATLTAAFQLVLDAQRNGETVAWLNVRQSTFFPPDAFECGVDLDALAVIRLAEAADIPRAADHLARSGSFGLLVLDLGANAHIPMPLQSRLLGLAQKHDIAIVCLTEKSGECVSLGSLVSLRALTTTKREPAAQFSCSLFVVKDKRRAPNWEHSEVRRGATGMR